MKSGAIGVVWANAEHTEVVLTQRTKPHRGWALPGGRVELNESFSEAFLRETQDETSVAARLIRPLQIEEKVFVSPDGEELPFVLASFIAEALPGQVTAQTEEATKEGLKVGVFSIHALPPDEDIDLQDKDKILRALSSSIEHR
ncbi:MAG TPA: NUDIX domain-containing protein [Candidatus Saccharimonadales bacterium]|nr:NUDIX domain-containing protein [Candidatus Saccharimonadales bacterium]